MVGYDNHYDNDDHVFRYVHHDGSPSFKDFSPFGGWTEPAIKQYDEGDHAGHYDYSY